jgi:uncharacterized membrane protein YkvA (DUF1232 family)
MPAESFEKQFVQRMRELLVALPYDMKVLFQAISDENLPMPARQLAAGAAIYCLSPSDPIPDSTGLLGYCDDVVVVRIALKRFLEVGGEDAQSYPGRFPEQFGRLDGDLELLRKYLGSSMDWVLGRLDKTLLKARYKGKDALTYITEDEACEFLYEEGQDFTTRYEIDDEAVARLQSGKPVVEAFRRRMAEEARMQG